MIDRCAEIDGRERWASVGWDGLVRCVGTANHHGDTVTHMCLTRNANGVAVGGISVRRCFPSTVLRCIIQRPLAILNVRNGCSVGTGLSNNNFANRDRTLQVTVTETLIGVGRRSGGTLGDRNFLAHSSHGIRHGGSNRPGTHGHFRFSGHWSVPFDVWSNRARDSCSPSSSGPSRNGGKVRGGMGGGGRCCIGGRFQPATSN